MTSSRPVEHAILVEEETKARQIRAFFFCYRLYLGRGPNLSKILRQYDSDHLRDFRTIAHYRLVRNSTSSDTRPEGLSKKH